LTLIARNIDVVGFSEVSPAPAKND